MKINKILAVITFGLITLSGCQSGIVWDEVPESTTSKTVLANYSPIKCGKSITG